MKRLHTQENLYMYYDDLYHIRTLIKASVGTHNSSLEGATKLKFACMHGTLACLLDSQSPAWSEGNGGDGGGRETLHAEVGLEAGWQRHIVGLALQRCLIAQPTPTALGLAADKDLRLYTLPHAWWREKGPCMSSRPLYTYRLNILQKVTQIGCLATTKIMWQLSASKQNGTSLTFISARCKLANTHLNLCLVGGGV